MHFELASRENIIFTEVGQGTMSLAGLGRAQETGEALKIKSGFYLVLVPFHICRRARSDEPNS